MKEMKRNETKQQYETRLLEEERIQVPYFVRSNKYGRSGQIVIVDNFVHPRPFSPYFLPEQSFFALKFALILHAMHL
jgi:hypothetical protein